MTQYMSGNPVTYYVHELGPTCWISTFYCPLTGERHFTETHRPTPEQALQDARELHSSVAQILPS